MSGRFKVLVVEDEALLRLDLRTYIEQAGYDVVEASSATEAIAVLENDRTIRVVFTDVRMPGDMDGAELARYIRRRWPPTLIVICSANSNAVDDLADILIVDKPYAIDQINLVLKAVAEQLH